MFSTAEWNCQHTKSKTICSRVDVFENLHILGSIFQRLALLIIVINLHLIFATILISLLKTLRQTLPKCRNTWNRSKVYQSHLIKSRNFIRGKEHFRAFDTRFCVFVCVFVCAFFLLLFVSFCDLFHCSIFISKLDFLNKSKLHSLPFFDIYRFAWCKK